MSTIKKDVIQYLKDHPDFFIKHPELLDHMSPPKADKDTEVVDFQAFMMQRIKEDKKKIEARNSAIIENTRANMNVQTRINTAIVRLLDARSFEEFIDLIITELAVILDVDAITIVIEARDTAMSKIDINGIRLVDDGVVQHFMNGKTSLLESDCVGHEIIYGSMAGMVRSQALQALDISSISPNAMIAFGSRNPEMFNPGQGRELIGFLADVIERMIRHWLQLP